MSGPVHLVAVQARVTAGRLGSEEGFAGWVDELCERSRAGVDRRAPVLICFPELFALPLLLGPAAGGGAPRSLFALVLQLLRRHPWPILAAALRRRSLGPRALLLGLARQAYPLYHRVFSEAARRHGVYLVAGSTFLPSMDHEVSLGTFLVAPAVHNTCSVFNPAGREVVRALKAHLTSGVESWLLDPAPGRAPAVVPTALGRLGVLLCYDAFFEAELRQMDAAGAEILVQPSANDGWDRPWKHNRRRGTSLSEAEVWVQHGVQAGIQGRENIRYAVNPMLVGEVAGISFSGRSSVVANTARVGGEAVLARAASSNDEAIVSATVEL